MMSEEYRNALYHSREKVHRAGLFHHKASLDDFLKGLVNLERSQLTGS